jgi:hypothetical protein
MRTKAFKIYETDYVLRISARDKGNRPIKPSNVVARVNRMKSYWGNPYLTITSLWYSGMIHMAKTQIKEKGRDLTPQEWMDIHKVFNYPVQYWGKTRARYRSVL